MNQDNSSHVARLKKVYSLIDKQTMLYWTHRDSNDLIVQKKGERTRRSQVTVEKKEENNNFTKDNNAQFGYGEITQVSKPLALTLDCRVQ